MIPCCGAIGWTLFAFFRVRRGGLLITPPSLAEFAFSSSKADEDGFVAARWFLLGGDLRKRLPPCVPLSSPGPCKFPAVRTVASVGALAHGGASRGCAFPSNVE